MALGVSVQWLELLLQSLSAAWVLLALRRPLGSGTARQCCQGGLWLLSPDGTGVALCCWPVSRQRPRKWPRAAQRSGGRPAARPRCPCVVPTGSP